MGGLEKLILPFSEDGAASVSLVPWCGRYKGKPTPHTAGSSLART